MRIEAQYMYCLLNINVIFNNVNASYHHLMIIWGISCSIMRVLFSYYILFKFAEL
jgi:hypothetical protein